MTGKGRFSSVTLLVLLGLGCVAGATVGFKPLQSYSAGLNPVAAVAADFNGDSHTASRTLAIPPLATTATSVSCSETGMEHSALPRTSLPSRTAQVY